MQTLTIFSYDGFQQIGFTLIFHTLSCAYFAISRTPIYQHTKRQLTGSSALTDIQCGEIGKISNFFDLELDDIMLVNGFNQLARK